MAVIKKQKGNFLEDFRVGHVFRHKVGKTLTEGLFNAFTEVQKGSGPRAQMEGSLRLSALFRRELSIN